MTRTLRYATQFDPPAPVMRVAVRRPLANESVLIPCLVDTGADSTVIPARLAIDLQLEPAEATTVVVANGLSEAATVYWAHLFIEGCSRIAKIVGFRDCSVVGRDVLEAMTITLNGPRREMHVRF